MYIDASHDSICVLCYGSYFVSLSNKNKCLLERYCLRVSIYWQIVMLKRTFAIDYGLIARGRWRWNCRAWRFILFDWIDDTMECFFFFSFAPPLRQSLEHTYAHKVMQFLHTTSLFAHARSRSKKCDWLLNQWFFFCFCNEVHRKTWNVERGQWGVKTAGESIWTRKNKCDMVWFDFLFQTYFLVTY